MQSHKWKVGTLAEVRSTPHRSLARSLLLLLTLFVSLVMQMFPDNPSLLGTSVLPSLQPCLSCPSSFAPALPLSSSKRKKTSYHLRPPLVPFHNNPGLNVNRGFKILLRLRPHQAPDTFYEVDQLVLVMLHEVRFFSLAYHLHIRR